MMDFEKYEALGNDYLVTLERQWLEAPARQLAQICHRHHGIGADGILVLVSGKNQWSVRIYNADGSEAEKSGNGVRIAARFLVDTQHCQGPRVALATRGGLVSCELSDHAADRHSCLVSGGLGTARFERDATEETERPPRMIQETIQAGNEPLMVTALSLGNPHCVLFRDHLSRAETERLGPILESHPRFPQRTNVQFARVVDRSCLELQIWERGSGFTFSSGSSSAAAACAAIRLGLTDRHVTCRMPGGTLDVVVDEDFRATIAGPVRRIGSIRLADGFRSFLGEA